MRLGSSRLGTVVACASALGAWGCAPPTGCPEGSEEVDGLCLALDAGVGEDPVEGAGQGGDGGVGQDASAGGSDAAAAGGGGRGGGDDGSGGFGTGGPSGGAGGSGTAMGGSGGSSGSGGTGEAGGSGGSAGSGGTGGVGGSAGEAGGDGGNDICATSANPCDTDPPACVTLTPAEGSFLCECPEGYSGNGRGEDGCQDIDECEAPTSPCDTMPLAACTNTTGDFECTCPDGYEGSGRGEDGCLDVDECATDNGGCDALTTCTNNEGAPPSCGPCPEGYAGNGEQGCEPRLLGLDVSSGTLSPAFDPETNDYQVSVPLVVQAASVTPRSPAGAEVTVDNEPVESGEASAPIALDLGETPVEVRVSRAGQPASTYTLLITRGELGAYLKASNTEAGDHFGGNVSLSGDTLAVGVPSEASAGTGVGADQADNSAPNAGAVYVFQRSAGSWAQQAYLKASNADPDDHFGGSVSLSGDTLAVGASGEASATRGVGADQADNSAPNAGAVYIFQRSGSGWAQQAYLKASNADPDDYFGGTVSLSGDTLAVGAGGEADRSGAVYVFQRSGSAWAQQAYLKASNTQPRVRFGSRVSLSGDTLAVGTPLELSAATGVDGDQADRSASTAGAVYVFQRSGSGWAQQAYLKASNTDAGDQFGSSVSLSGDTLAVGAREEASAATGVGGDQADNSAPRAGAVYIFQRSAGSWAQQAYLKASNAEGGDQFGSNVSLSGDTLAVGARNEDSAATTGVNGDQANNSATDAGAVYVFQRSGGSWAQEAYLKPSNTDAGDGFGASVSLSGDTLAVGATDEDSAATDAGGDQADNSATEAGAVYIY